MASESMAGEKHGERREEEKRGGALRWEEEDEEEETHIQRCLPWVVEHDCREVFTGFGEVGHRETQCAEQTALKHTVH